MSHSLPTLGNIVLAILAFLPGLAIISPMIWDMYYVPEYRYVMIFIQSVLAVIALLYLSAFQPELISLKIRNMIGIGVFLVVVGGLVSVITSDFPFRALFRQAEVFISIINVWLLSRCLKSDDRLLNGLSILVLLAFIITMLDELSLWLMLEAPNDNDWVQGWRNYLHVRHVGDMASVGLVLGSYLLARPGWRWRISGAVGVFISTVALLFSSGRASVIASTMAVIVLFWMCRKLPGYAVRLSVPIATAVLTVIAMAPEFRTPGTPHWPGIWRMFMAFGQTTGEGEFVNSSGRNVMWKAVWDRSLNSPWVGYGADTYVYQDPFLYGQTPHNTLLQFVMDWGWPVGLVAFYLLLWISFKALVIIFNESQKYDLTAAGFWAVGYGVFMLHGLVATTFYEPLDMVMVTVMMAVICANYSHLLNDHLVIKMPFRWILAVFLSSVLFVNFQAGNALYINEKMRRGQGISKSDVLWLMDNHYSLSGFWWWSGNPENLEKVDLDYLETQIWLSRYVEYYSYLADVRVALYWKEQGQESLFKTWLDKAWQDKPILDIHLSTRRLCNEAGIMEDDDRCRAELDAIEDKIILGRWFRQHPVHFAD
ncbi:O-antigen ligase family protein [Oceanobacter mangrovi]|uniref:O-antigen ligase family protein n=1 Tax=Oceanobacter mangrovi TaxID=2862510 RepID=UPI001C8E112E|nr:O-antigen ligase family protein [Oceanobacter mangrovi]